MEKPIKLLLVWFFVFLNWGDTANILSIITTPLYSHHKLYQPLWRELSLRGHNVTVFTTEVMKDPTLTNLTEVDISYGYDIAKKHQFVELLSNDSKSFLEIGKGIRLMYMDMEESIFCSKEGQELIHNKDLHFDLLIVEAQMPSMTIFSWKFKCPYIGISSLDASLPFHDASGNPSHPIANPDKNIPIKDHKDMTFKERFVSTIFNILFRTMTEIKTYPIFEKMIQQYFGTDVPRIIDLLKNMSLLIVTTNPIFHEPRPVMPNTITIGSGMHISPPKELPKDIQTFLNEAKDGAIYFSLGTLITGGLLNETTKAAIMEAFSEIPYKVILKDADFKKVPKNVKVEDWIPQQDVLAHPNVKLFISHGGLQSLQEAVYNNVPLIGIPFFGDQIYNVERMVSMGYGIKIEKHNITKKSLKNAIIEIFNNPKYSEKVSELGDIFRDQEIGSLETAVWWVEYVLRHNGAAHWKSPIVEMPLWKFYMLDVISFVTGVLLVVVLLLYIIIINIVEAFRRCTKDSNNKTHTE